MQIVRFLVRRPPQFRRFPPSNHSTPGYAPVALGGFMLSYQVTAQFAFHQHRSALVSTHIKKQRAKAFLVLSGLPFGHGLKCSRFFHTKKKRFNMSPVFIKFTKAALFQIPPFPAVSFHYFRRFQMCSTKINTIPGFIAYVRENSTWQTATIRNVIHALGYNT
jgi:hypothetical protein